MRTIRILAALALATTASYAWAAAPEGLGRPMLRGSGRAPATAPDIADIEPPGAMARRIGRTLGGLKPEGRATTRGANESRIYREASPAVVLIVSDESLGSGALIGADGRIITNLHVVGDADEVGVVFKPAAEGVALTEANVVVGKVIKRDQVADLALVQVSSVPAGVKPLVIGAVADVEVGSDVHAIGHPTGEAWTYTRGIVSQLRRNYTWRAEDRVEHTATVIQTQTPINPGNSGGPLLDDKLAVVGVNSFGAEGEGLNFAVSADDVKAFLARSGDRMAARPAPRTAASCEQKIIDSEPTKDPAGDVLLVDIDCDGVGDFMMDVPDDEKLSIDYLFDTDDDGKVDAIYVDEDRDGEPNEAFFDTDANGKFDMRGDFRDGEDEPFRYEKIKEE